MINFGKGRDRGLVVCKDFPIERNEISLPCILPKLVKTE